VTTPIEESAPDFASDLAELQTELSGLPDKLSAKVVPESLMAIPIELAIDWLYHHGRSCRKPKVCPDTPGPLRVLLSVHNRRALLGHRSLIHSELWAADESLMALKIRNRILDVEKELVAELEGPGGIQTVRELLTGEERVDATARLAAALWALGLQQPEHRQLFRLLPALAPEAEDGSRQSPEKTNPPTEPSEKERHKRRRKDAEDRVRELERKVTAQKTKNRESAKELSRIQKALEKVELARGESRKTSESLQGELDTANNRIRELEVELRDTRGSAQVSQQASNRLREELQGAEEQLDIAERETHRLVAELASLRTEHDSLEAALRSIPQGKDAIDAFLQEEEERIDQDLLILQGADRQRAESDHATRQKLEAAFREAYPEYVPPRPASIGAPGSLTFTALGGGAEVGRSAYLVEIGLSRVLIDCGIAVGQTKFDRMVPDLTKIGALDAIVLTHSHTDHIGWLPALVRHQDATVPIYCTRDTAAIVPIMLDDARGHYERRLAKAELIASHDPDAMAPIEHYSREDIRDVETRLRALRYEEPVGLPSTGLRLAFSPAGHILGAASALLEGVGRQVLISGDISSERQLTVAPAQPPPDLTDVDLLVLESTYGGEIRDGGNAPGELVEFVRETTRAGTALLPCFALGRGQEVLQILLRARKHGELDPEVTIWVDGLIRKILPTYVEAERIGEEGYEVISSASERSFAIAGCRRNDARAVVVTTSGMLNGGPIVEWARALLPEARNKIALLGYQDEGSAGGSLRRELRQGGRPPFSLTLHQEDGKDLNLKLASPPREIGLSAHADQRGLVDFARKIGARQIALVHGDPSAQEILQAKLAEEMPGSIVSCPGREPFQVP